jgi:16S rRNA (cytosine1402-N4)-methyltransferase
MPLDVKDGNGGFFHRPVLLREVLNFLGVVPGGIYADCTLGGGGHSYEILRISSPGGKLIGLDRDRDAVAAASQKLSQFRGRATLIHSDFVYLPGILDDLDVKQVDGILYDLGVSSYQLDNPERGFTYMQDAPLDMRMDRNSGLTAADLVNSAPEKELVKIIRDYGEERFAGRIASFIARERAREPIATTGRLAEIVKRAIPARYRREGPHPARRTFQAIRIAVNNELGALAGALREAVDRLKPGGRVCVITFHSLEDRIVKQSFREMAQRCTCPKDFPVCACGRKPLLKIIRPGGITPSAEEMEENPRSRSARLRVAERCI